MIGANGTNATDGSKIPGPKTLVFLVSPSLYLETLIGIFSGDAHGDAVALRLRSILCAHQRATGTTTQGRRKRVAEEGR